MGSDLFCPITCYSTIIPQSIYSGEMKTYTHNNILYVNVFGRFVCSCQKTGNISNVHQHINREIVVYPHNEILLSNKKEQTVATPNNMNGYPNHAK